MYDEILGDTEGRPSDSRPVKRRRENEVDYSVMKGEGDDDDLFADFGEVNAKVGNYFTAQLSLVFITTLGLFAEHVV